jgi:hypothetical protein
MRSSVKNELRRFSVALCDPTKMDVDCKKSRHQVLLRASTSAGKEVSLSLAASGLRLRWPSKEPVASSALVTSSVAIRKGTLGHAP